jgi:hypothetical protein
MLKKLKNGKVEKAKNVLKDSAIKRCLKEFWWQIVN